VDGEVHNASAKLVDDAVEPDLARGPWSMMSSLDTAADAGF
jgi:hypothetical protein